MECATYNRNTLKFVASVTHPPIRSYVLRQGRFSPRAAARLRRAAAALGRALPGARPWTFAAVFGRVAPVVVEIGSGMGETTARIARENPGHRLPRDRSARARRRQPAQAARGRAAIDQRARGPARRGRGDARHGAAGFARGPARLLPRSVAEEAPPQAPPDPAGVRGASPPSASRPAATCTSPPTGRTTPSTCSAVLRRPRWPRQHRGSFRAAAGHASGDQVRAPRAEAGPWRMGHRFHEERHEQSNADRARAGCRVVARAGRGGRERLHVARCSPRATCRPGLHRLDGTATVNGTAAQVGHAGRARATRSPRGPGSQAVVVLKGDAFLHARRHRDRGEGPRAACSPNCSIATGQGALGVLEEARDDQGGDRDHRHPRHRRLHRGRAEEVYFCLCYGEAVTSTGPNMPTKTVKTKHHEQPLLLTDDGRHAARRARAASATTPTRSW